LTVKFAIATNDAYQCVLETFLKAGWKLEKLFISPSNWLYDNKQVVARALELGASIQHSPISDRDLADLGDRGCTALIVACYQWKVPDWSAHIKYAVNFHPSPLPEGRGPYPMVRAILEEHTSWAITCHRISQKFDQGDILDAENFSLAADENHETLNLKIQLAVPRLARRIANNIESLWNSALPQGTGSYWPMWVDRDRTLDFKQPVRTIALQIRAFGSLECLAAINNVIIFVHRAHAWQESHPVPPGDLVHSSNLAMVIAASDGFVAITEWSLVAPGAITSSLRR
jgi:methionyl-tRNA formyltransferase